MSVINNGLLINFGYFLVEGNAAANGGKLTFPQSFTTTHYHFLATNKSNATFWTGNPITSNNDDRNISWVVIGAFQASVVFCDWICIGY